MVEHHLAKVRVAGSSPVSRSVAVSRFHVVLTGARSDALFVDLSASVHQAELRLLTHLVAEILRAPYGPGVSP